MNRDKSVPEYTSDGVLTWNVANLFTPCSGKETAQWLQAMALANCLLPLQLHVLACPDSGTLKPCCFVSLKKSNSITGGGTS